MESKVYGTKVQYTSRFGGGYCEGAYFDQTWKPDDIEKK
jgi:hypothetical protein